MSFDEIDITLRARNSSGEQKLYLSRDGDDFWFTLCGEHEGKKIQIDFDTLSRGKLEDIRAMIELILEETKDK